jgi:YVTN family beta-propeller protein
MARRLFISNEETAEVTVLDVSTGKVTRMVPVGREPEGVTVRPEGKVVYVTCEGEGEVVAIDAETLKVIPACTPS